MATTAPALTGTWNADTTHSTLEFSARHMVVATYRGRLPRFEASLTVGEDGAAFTGTADAASITTEDENLTGHLMSPEFLDTARHPHITFVSHSVRIDGDDVTIEGDLTAKGITRPVTFRGAIAGPADDPWGNTRLGLEVAAKIERSDFDMNWNAPLPGGGLVLGNTVTLSAQLELIRAA